MKKSITILLLTMLMGVSTAMAEDLYVYVAGKKLNVNNNYSNETEGLTSGSYSYYSSTKKLVLNKATIVRDGSGKNGIDSNLSGLKIEFVGTNTITTGDDALVLRASTDMYGTGTVNIKSHTEEAMFICKGRSSSIADAIRPSVTTATRISTLPFSTRAKSRSENLFSSVRTYLC